MGALKSIARICALAWWAIPLAARGADQPLPMVPASDWVVDRAGDSCVARRTFQAGDQQATLQLRQLGPGDGFQVVVLSSTLQGANAEPRVRWEPDQGYDEPAALNLRRDESRGAIFGYSLRPAVLEPADDQGAPDWPDAEREARERGVTGLTVRSVFWHAVTLQTGSMHEPMEAMRACADRLLEHWGLDPTTQRTLSRRPRPVDWRTGAEKCWLPIRER